MTAAPSQRSSPALRLLTSEGRLVTRRALVIAIGLAARIGLFRAYAIWPTIEEPMLGIEVGRRRPASWACERLDERDDPLAGPRRLLAKADAPTWQVLRARALLRGRPPEWLIRVCGQALQRDLPDASIVLRSPTGSPVSKAILYVFEARGTAPSAIAIAMSDPTQSARLQRETELVEDIRESLGGSGDIAGALPLQPLFAGSVATTGPDEYVAVYPLDPMDQPQGPNRGRSLEWLGGFQEATSAPGAWDSADTQRCVETVESAWSAIRGPQTAEVAARVASHLEPLQGSDVPWCAVHGDFWEGNLVHRHGGLRVYDWEWAIPRGRPFLDPWTYEFGLMLDALDGERDLVAVLRESLRNVEDWLERRRLDSRFAIATMAPAIAELAIRMRRTTGTPGPAEVPLGKIMAASEELMPGA